MTILSVFALFIVSFIYSNFLKGSPPPKIDKYPLFELLINVINFSNPSLENSYCSLGKSNPSLSDLKKQCEH